GGVAGVVVHVAHALGAFQFDAFFQQVLVDVDQAAPREYFLKLVACQLVVAGATADHHRLDVKIVKGGSHTVEQHAVVSDDLVGFVVHAIAALGVATAQVTRRQYRLHPGVPQHGLGGQAHLREQALRPTARKVKHRFGIGRRFRAADNRYVVRVFNIQQFAGGWLGQVARHLLVDEVDDLFANGRFA